jgi:hypothetical protein
MLDACSADPMQRTKGCSVSSALMLSLCSFPLISSTASLSDLASVRQAFASQAFSFFESCSILRFFIRSS